MAVSCETQGLAGINPVFSKVQLEVPSIRQEQGKVRPIFLEDFFYPSIKLVQGPPWLELNNLRRTLMGF